MGYPEKSASGPVLWWREGSIAHIRFNRPQSLNAIDVAMARTFLQACTQISADPLVRAVWLTAEGRAFMAGGDIAAMASDPVPVADALIEGMHGGLRLLAQTDAPVLVSVHGAVSGAGVGLVLGAADIIVAAENTRFCVAYPLIGASCDCATSWALPRIVGLRKALELALLSDTITAEEALCLGLCNRVVALEALESESRTLVERLAQGPSIAYGNLRRLIRQSLHSSFEDQLDAEALGFRECATTRDFGEGVAAFQQKRRAAFQGR
ncbi:MULTISPECIES: enoyl-CoA hydratase/isomerase family protein [unclassified Delftia]|uniref:enoyl-CoA hydratase/isomerase family protein n=1 Tax=unclassified Delftia TaxID=2613839 RepID=UPI00190121EE|nr:MULTISPECIES: enoyl-CoA hydratase-related protein [unclassified Delftia]MBK0114040.1 enoyl-CoA hydratase/isomerase family protein [Delftia sp. S65]MBK0117848.1 enoyl-CoA hydratase/isomerase family protein [Delftia sp. S67]MBK0129153.1 enoyl-CoA hydratase/isomerase family protein [Delftia sp. S66]